jgi:hypothetical protein
LPCIWEPHRRLRAVPQQNASGSNLDRVSRASVITAKPERVTLSDGSGSTEIDWDTGNGSMGFVFVTEDGGKPGLFANGSRGKEVTPWIGKHSYVFELYGDDQRQTLLAKVTVFGSAESTSSQQTVSWQVVARWALNIGLGAVLYFAVYLNSMDRCEQHFQPSLGRRHVRSTLDETFSSGSLRSFASTVPSFIVDCMSRSWLQVPTRDVSRKLREPKRSALHQV